MQITIFFYTIQNQPIHVLFHLNISLQKHHIFHVFKDTTPNIHARFVKKKFHKSTIDVECSRNSVKGLHHLDET